MSRAVVVANLRATAMSGRALADVVAVLRHAYDVTVAETRARGHATELAAAADADLVVALGGDGTANEVVNGLAGRDVPLAVLPAGSTNVIARNLGVSNDLGKAARRLSDGPVERRIDVGVVNGRRFLFACGAGLDATAARRVEAHPALKSKLGPVGFTYAAVAGFLGEYVGGRIKLRVSAGDRVTEGVTAVVQNSAPFAYFGPSEVALSQDLAVDDGQLAIVTLRRANLVDIPFLMGRILVPPLGGAQAHRHIDEFRDVTSARITAIGGRLLPVQVDGDYIGEFRELDISIEPSAMRVLV